MADVSLSVGRSVGRAPFAALIKLSPVPTPTRPTKLPSRPAKSIVRVSRRSEGVNLATGEMFPLRGKEGIYFFFACCLAAYFDTGHISANFSYLVVYDSIGQAY